MNDETQFARNLRNNATPEERALWQILSSYRPRFTRQLKLRPFVADFACRRARVLVELDGSQHAESKTDDARTRLLEGRGWRVIRFWNSDIHDSIDGVVAAIAALVQSRLPPGETFEAQPSRAGRERKLR